MFYEYFHGDNGAGLGASHQTGWTGVIAGLIRLAGMTKAEDIREHGTHAVVRVTGKATAGAAKKTAVHSTTGFPTRRKPLDHNPARKERRAIVVDPEIATSAPKSNGAICFEVQR